MTCGSAVILYELLKHLPGEEFVAVHGVSDPPNFNGTALGIERHMVLVLGSYGWSLRCARRLPGLYVPLVRRQIVRLARAHGVQRIYAHYPNSAFLIAAWQAAEKLDLPLTVYFDILWEESHPCDAALARKYEKRILARADSRFAITEFAADYLSKKHGLRVEFLPHTIDAALCADGFQPPPDGDRPTVHFCGGIFPAMNQDAVVRTVEAAQRAKCRPRLDFCTPDLPAELRSRGLQSRYLSRNALRAEQRRSTMLLVPQAFSTSQAAMIHYNFPTKVMEYLCAGRPMLVHAPADCYLTWLAKKEGFALVVDRPDTEALAAAIDRLAVDRDLQEELVARAFRFAETRDSRHWAGVLWKALCGA